jgi:hypothetical protein
MSRLIKRITVAALFSIAFGFPIAFADSGDGGGNGGIELGSNGPQSISVANFHYDLATNTFNAGDWRYHPSISVSETYDLFQAVGANDVITVDVSPLGNATASGLPRSSKVTKRMIVADLLLGDITKGFGYITPLYRLANDYVPLPYETRAGSQRFVEYYVFTPARFVVTNGVLTSPGRTVKGVSAPVVVHSDGTRSVDTAAAAAGTENPAIKRNMAHVLTNIDYYFNERVVQEMAKYAEVAEFARVLKKNGVRLDDIWHGRP